MKNKRTPAEVITAILFDAIEAPRPRTSVLNALLGQKSSALIERPSPRYRTITEARKDLESLGIPASFTNYLLTGLSDLVFEVVTELEGSVNGFKRRTHVEWDAADAYLGVRFRHEAVAPTLDMMPHVLPEMRKRFLVQVGDILEKRARTSLAPEVINHAAKLVYA